MFFARFSSVVTEICRIFASYTTRTFVGSGSKQRTRSPSLYLEQMEQLDSKCLLFAPADDVEALLVVGSDELLELAVVALVTFAPVMPSFETTFGGDVFELLEFGALLVELLLEDTILAQQSVMEISKQAFNVFPNKLIDYPFT